MMPIEGLTREEYRTLVRNIKMGMIQELHDKEAITDTQFEYLMRLQGERNAGGGEGI